MPGSATILCLDNRQYPSHRCNGTTLSSEHDLSGVMIETKNQQAQLSHAEARRLFEDFAREQYWCEQGVTLADIGKGKCVMFAPFDRTNTELNGCFSSGYMAALAETSGVYASMSARGEGRFETVACSMNFLEIPEGSALQIEASVISDDDEFLAISADIHIRNKLQNDVLVAKFLATIAVKL